MAVMVKAVMAIWVIRADTAHGVDWEDTVHGVVGADRVLGDTVVVGEIGGDVFK